MRDSSVVIITCHHFFGGAKMGFVYGLAIISKVTWPDDGQYVQKEAIVSRQGILTV